MLHPSNTSQVPPVMSSRMSIQEPLNFIAMMRHVLYADALPVAPQDAPGSLEPRPATTSQLKYYREIRGWSQQRVAEQIQTNTDTVGKWERGINVPSPFFREKLCLLYGVSADVLGLI